MKTEQVNLDDMRSWGRALRSYPGAFGSGMSEPDDPYPDGSVRGHIPIQEWQVRGIWEAGNLEKNAPNSGWHQIGNFREFKLEIRGYKLRGGFISPSKWLASVGFWFGEVSNASVQIDNFGFLKATTIPDIFLTVDKLLLAECPLVKNLDEALRSS